MSTTDQPIFVNDLPYEQDGTDDPLRSIEDTLAFSVDDWSATRALAWVYGIVLGWDAPDDEPEEGAMDELAAKFGWTSEQVARLRTLHAGWLARRDTP